MEAALHFLAPEMLASQASGQEFDRIANRARDNAPQGVYPCAGDDEWCAVAVDTDAQWAALRALLGEPAWAQDAALDSAEGRLAAHDHIDAKLAAWTREREPRAAMAELLDAGVPAGHVQRSSDLLVDPQLAHRGFHRSFEHGEMGLIPYAGHQYRITGYDHGPRHAAPLIGGETFEILTEDLGFDPERVAEWIGAGVLE